MVDCPIHLGGKVEFGLLQAANYDVSLAGLLEMGCLCQHKTILGSALIFWIRLFVLLFVLFILNQFYFYFNFINRLHFFRILLKDLLLFLYIQLIRQTLHILILLRVICFGSKIGRAHV